MKYDLQEKIAHLLREFGVVPTLQRFQDFVASSIK